MIAALPPYVAPPAEVRPALAGCEGLNVSRIDVRTYRPSARTAGDRAAAATTEAVGLEYRRTRAFVIRAYLRLREGDLCTEQHLRESAQLLRAQRFVASAAVTAAPDGAGGVRIFVDVVDEVPIVGSVQFRGLSPSAASIGTQNLGGRGVTAIVGANYEPGYRLGTRVVLGQSGALGRPALADVEWQRRPLGSLWRVQYAEPFLTDGQVGAVQLGASQEAGFPTLVRPGDEDVVVRTSRMSYHAGWVRRIEGGSVGRLVGLAGVMLMGTEILPGSLLSLRTDSGLVSTDDSSLVGRYRPHANGRVGLVSGLRFLTFKTVRRFETLRAEQDIASGFEVDGLLGPSMNRSAGARDMLVGGDLYLARGGASSFVAFKARAEGRVTGRDEQWEDVVGSARLSWLRLPSSTRTRIVTLSASTIQNLSFPAQLTFRDHEGGLLAYPEGGDAGATRAVLRVEERRLLPWLSRRAGLATAWVADVGHIWAGDAPFGATSPLRGSLGVSLLGAYPVTSKRTIRLDLAIPINPGPGDARFVVRMTSGDRTGVFWSEPHDVSRARAAAGPVSLTRW